MKLVARMLFKLSQDLHHTLSQGPTPTNTRFLLLRGGYINQEGDKSSSST